MWRGVGVERDAEGLAAAAGALAALPEGTDAGDRQPAAGRPAGRRGGRPAHREPRRPLPPRPPPPRPPPGAPHRLGRRPAPTSRPRPRRPAPPGTGQGGRMTTTAPACALPVDGVPRPEELRERAWAARHALGSRAVVLGHHYQKDEVIEFADVTGDSFLLARRGAAATEAELIVFLGVYFMAEAADVLKSPGQTVVLPDLGAGCHLAECADIFTVRDAWDQMTAALPGRARHPADLHELGRRPEGLRRRARRRRLHLRQRRAGLPLGALGGRRGLLLPRRAPGAEHGLPPGHGAGRAAGLEPAPGGPRRARGGGPRRRAGHPLEGLLQRPHAFTARQIARGARGRSRTCG